MQPQQNNLKLKPSKSEICRFYLRGLCMFNSHDCYFSHGVWDLLYLPWTQGQKIIYDYSKVQKEDKQQIVKGQRNYINLYEYQRQKIFTLPQLNQDRQKRQLIRNQMHAQMFNDFMDLLRCYYPDALFTQDFLIRQFTRVGFNKTMSIIKITHICAYVCDPPSSRFFKINLLMPPYSGKQTTYILPSVSDEENLNFYKNCYEQYAQNSTQQQLTEANIKKYLFSVTRPNISLLPLNIYLKNKKMNFSNFLKLITNNLTEVVMETNPQVLLKAVLKYVQQKVESQNGYSNWSDVYKFIGQQHKVNNANVTNPLRPRLIEKGYIFLNFPMFQIITSPQKLSNWKFNCIQGHQSVCQCSFKKMYPEQQLMLNLLNFNQELPPKQSFDIYDMDSLLKCAGTILKSPILGVDLEGRLRRNGYIQMIQINTGLNTFLFDIHRILKNADLQTFELAKKILRNAFCNPKVVKIFHDCRHDCLVLHEIMNTCVINIFDTSATQTFIGQIEVYKTEKNNKQILKTITNVKTPGYNDLLRKYNAPHGINKNKQWFHELWRKGHTELFQQRPLHPEYRQYCIKDVLDLPFLHGVMGSGFSAEFTNWLGSHYVRQGYLYTIETQ